MTELRTRMIRDLQLAGLVEGTREYLRAVRQLAAYYMIRPDQLSERQVEDYILYVRDDLGVAKGDLRPDVGRPQVPLRQDAGLRLAPVHQKAAPASWCATIGKIHKTGEMISVGFEPPGWRVLPSKR